MLVRLKHETDGQCFAKMQGDCTALSRKDKRCGTYGCPFYKPKDCEKWYRKDFKWYVHLYEPDEIEVMQDGQ